MADAPEGFIAGIVRRFLKTQLSLILIIASLALGVSAILVTPREEEPQIVVPLADVFVQAPGASPGEVERLVAEPLERLLWQIDGVEYVYSISRRDMAVVTVRFFVGEDREASLIKLHNRITMHIDEAPSIVRGWVVKPVEIDDVPILNIVLHSDRYDDHALRRIGEELLARLAEVPDISRTEVVGGRRREVRVALSPERMRGSNVSPLMVRRALAGADASVTAGTFDRFNRVHTVVADSFLTSAGEVAGLVVGVHRGRPVHLRDIATVTDGPEEAETYTRIGFSDAWREARSTDVGPEGRSAVTLALSKKRGTNAVNVARAVLDRMDELERTVLPSGIGVEVTRNYGATAQEKVNDLLISLGSAILTVVVLLAFVLGWREASVVALAVPISFSLALFVNYLLGYTINRVTLFALILSLGLVVDDPITNVDNIQRHVFKGRRNPHDATMYAVQEVLPPVLMSTLAIIVTFTPLFFITGMMGPYMAPMAANVPVTVVFSTLCAVTVVPWFTYTLLKNRKPKKSGTPKPEKRTGEDASDGEGRVPENGGASGEEDDVEADFAVGGRVARVYRAAVGPFLDSRPLRWVLVVVVLALMAFAGLLAVFRLVPLKMLPFDNKNEFQIVVDMPEGTTLETTDGVLRDFEAYLRGVPEATSFVSYAGTASPMDFNGMVRHYYLRRGGHVGDIRVNLLEKSERDAQSHAIVLRLREDLERIARRHGAKIQIVEVPPGPPVLSTIVAEIYGEPDTPYEALIEAGDRIMALMAEEPFVVDIDTMAEAPHSEIDFVVDREKAALHGVDAREILESLRIALSGDTPATVHVPDERQPLRVRIVLPRSRRSGVAELGQIPVASASGAMVSLAELTEPVLRERDQPIFHKNLERVVFVLAEMAGRAPAEAVLDMQSRLAENPLPEGIRVDWAGEGEWKITLDVFRDMGIAFAAAMMGIYILLIIQTESFFMPLLLMMAIPLTLIGAMPGFWFLNLFAVPVGGFENPIFFTATGMIGMIALGGIVIRNSVVLIEFIQDAVRRGLAFREAILRSGAIRMRPILLTAATTALGAWPITLDPIFSGLAWTLIFGLVASTLFTLVVIPVSYYAVYRKMHEG